MSWLQSSCRPCAVRPWELAALLSPVLEALDIACVYRPALAMADEVMAAMETDLGAYAPLPGLASIPSVTPEQLGHLYHLAAQLYQASPWAWFHDHHPFAITCPRLSKSALSH